VLLVEAAAKALIGSQARRGALAAAAAACSAACRPIDDKRGTIVYRTKVAGVLLKAHHRHRAERAKAKRKLDHGKAPRFHHHQRRAAEFLCEPSDTMLDALRGPLGLTGSKEGCAPAIAAPAASRWTTAWSAPA
jgi:xanthine dehydrogenase iron-sulfur cluster and FAD-binding subunit A